MKKKVLLIVVCILFLGGCKNFFTKDNNIEEVKIIEDGPVEGMPAPIRFVKSISEMQKALGINVPILPYNRADSSLSVYNENWPYYGRIDYLNFGTFEIAKSDDELTSLRFNGIYEKTIISNDIEVKVFNTEVFKYAEWKYNDIYYAYRIDKNNNLTNFDEDIDTLTSQIVSNIDNSDVSISEEDLSYILDIIGMGISDDEILCNKIINLYTSNLTEEEYYIMLNSVIERYADRNIGYIENEMPDCKDEICSKYANMDQYMIAKENFNKIAKLYSNNYSFDNLRKEDKDGNFYVFTTLNNNYPIEGGINIQYNYFVNSAYYDNGNIVLETTRITEKYYLDDKKVDEKSDKVKYIFSKNVNGNYYLNDIEVY